VSWNTDGMHGLWLIDYRYIQLQEEYIKDEQRYDVKYLNGTRLVADNLQELEERVGARTGGDQADPECTFGYWTIYGSH